MKIVTIPLVERAPTKCNCFQGEYVFKKEWCLDLHGFLSRNEFAVRLSEINNYIRNVPISSKRTERCVISASMTAFALAALIAISFPEACIAVESLFFLGFLMALYQINRIARNRANNFNATLDDLFAQLNSRENPTANWKLRR
jgi:hypothetical protein